MKISAKTKGEYGRSGGAGRQSRKKQKIQKASMQTSQQCFELWQEVKMRKKVTCPYCGYEMPIFYTEKAISGGVYAKCKGRKCKKIFEIKIKVK